MRKLFIGLLSLGFILTSFTLFNGNTDSSTAKAPANSQINFQNITLDQALKLAKKEHKKVFINAYAVWCAPCKRMQNMTYKDANVAKYFNDHFVCLDIDVEKGNGPQIAQRYGVRAHPCLLFVNTDGSLNKTILGFYDGNALLAQVKQVK